MKHILLACTGGVSSSVVSKKIESYIKEQNLPMEVKAVRRAEIADRLDWADLLLLAPQVSHFRKQFEKQASEHGTVLETIAMIDYGKLNIKNIVSQIEKALA